MKLKNVIGILCVLLALCFAGCAPEDDDVNVNVKAPNTGDTVPPATPTGLTWLVGPLDCVLECTLDAPWRDVAAWVTLEWEDISEKEAGYEINVLQDNKLFTYITGPNVDAYQIKLYVTENDVPVLITVNAFIGADESYLPSPDSNQIAIDIDDLCNECPWIEL